MARPLPTNDFEAVNALGVRGRAAQSAAHAHSSSEYRYLFFRRQDPPGPSLKVSGQIEGADPITMQGRHMIPDGGEHAPDLVIAPLGDRKSGRRRVQGLKVRRRKGILFAVQHEQTACEPLRFIAVKRAIQGGDIALRHVAARRDHPM